MGQEINFYEVIKNILSERLKPPYMKKEIKAAIMEAIGGADYISAITAYLWGAYNNFDSGAKIAFKEIFFDDLKIHNASAFYFFSFYFLNDFKRTGFDRRDESDRRDSYSLDFFQEKIIERRQGRDRRKNQETRLNWTRVTKWVSVPFNTEEGIRGEDQADSPVEKKVRQLDNHVASEICLRPDEEMDIRSLNGILSALIIYFDIYIKQGRTEWLHSLDEEIFERAKKVMIKLTER
jgi:hypothetical protein